ncbi:ABC transporter substrate-binding protein [Ponticoccus sp. SC2-23]|uniref:ABC transporter substrate-binding protein n=1 Tax=Alexandriicola marinus TaxID=2081710 RepID=UPI00193C295D|nr:ABC transporter substrate-binding protein [Alexandriicola marinus]MBM1221616.1 ABC transporter substrate-binding protein [Ponticoccus sp. SC6-9]MBM1226657.1 ABC transporter substrate-binding protein [Ponticoccus sp. SC6-15]MBM1230608.1 ABC transporter substrate-binding protein [Ponticoccus sp. SC6-38]MBM1235131.1 ABC transporter substrate-binding protein [Ponticoccus sp. SC6-45]MBM1239629.1 ABC transporter substrate-binding protein [Ponticoccus sp. SC6-49]MBM1243411.1 ABC transporter subst
MTMTRRTFTKLAAASAMSGLAAPAIAQGNREIKMILNWRYQGPQSWFFLADDKGYFAEAGIDMVMDQGSGSGAAVGQVAGGAYDVGFGDVNALIRLAATNPDEAPICVYQMYNKPPFTVAVLSDSDIMTAEDLEGRLLGGAPNDGALKLFPAFANLAGLDTSSIEILNFQSSLREQMLRTEQVEGVFGYVNTIRFSAKLSGMNPDEDIRFISYGDYGMDLYSNGMIIPKAMAENEPEMVKGMIWAINEGVKDTLADLDAAVDSVAAREPLINKEVEKERLIATLQDEMNHPELATTGLGAVDPERFATSIDIVVEADQLPRTPDASEVYTDAFLPAEEDRIYSLL